MWLDTCLAPGRPLTATAAASHRREAPARMPAASLALSRDALEMALSRASHAGLPAWFTLVPEGAGRGISCRVVQVRPHPRWVEVDDGHLCLRLDLRRLHQVHAHWRATSQGLEGWLEGRDAGGQLLAQVQHRAAPGTGEACAWQRLMDWLLDEQDEQDVAQRGPARHGRPADSRLAPVGTPCPV